ncbi:hypothetical protein DNJ95_08130 [Stutzerimonas kirkiae]|uniref:Uncharacterized protein n=2 Tax=Stutzerimonas kirkiae TaxID=2211392 RepID=A0A4Q9RB47_9GAMM|nr:hypothetical protein DNJ96_06410 [Stutzerimonas kirkiae]TBV02921.1 hypothetical protein DNJ95_08130 [Stutzerimonas kirkiae]TBV11109.1 hypothetical protein DNK08_04030 [Stutzerimonas kirkiae]TBV13022.1 hypothetical protein DNK01_12795 [Stutzerimonas kirkiae]
MLYDPEASQTHYCQSARKAPYPDASAHIYEGAKAGAHMIATCIPENLSIRSRMVRTVTLQTALHSLANGSQAAKQSLPGTIQDEPGQNRQA